MENTQLATLATEGTSRNAAPVPGSNCLHSGDLAAHDVSMKGTLAGACWACAAGSLHVYVQSHEAMSVRQHKAAGAYAVAVPRCYDESQIDEVVDAIASNASTWQDQSLAQRISLLQRVQQRTILASCSIGVATQQVTAPLNWSRACTMTSLNSQCAACRRTCLRLAMYGALASGDLSDVSDTVTLKESHSSIGYPKHKHRSPACSESLPCT
jgi:hypothetical protein